MSINPCRFISIMAVEASTQALHGVGFDSVAHDLKHGGYYVLLQGCFDANVCLEPFVF